MLHPAEHCQASVEKDDSADVNDGAGAPQRKSTVVSDKLFTARGKVGSNMLFADQIAGFAR